MCLVLIAYHHHPQYPLIVAANRDEYFRRPTAAARFWDTSPEILGGRDLEKGGTWMAVDRQGRFAAVTNYYEPSTRQPGRLSRGALVSDFLLQPGKPDAYLAGVAKTLARYDGFNLFTADDSTLWFISSTSVGPRQLPPGVYGISNGELDNPWPKVLKAKHMFTRILETAGTLSPTHFFGILLDRDIPVGYLDPAAGDRHVLTPVFVSKGEFGTRSSTVLLVNIDGDVLFHEKTFDRHGQELEDTEIINQIRY